ncbi:polyketide synthase [Serratia plymuthica]|uniref:Polyketide synthase n=3 Tax=Serratia TaxID=613 RepID=A0A318P693_SERPL|nr:SDR family NAD(P)-dependent oxidoreductase [Serratia plymuthica]PYD40062.1 polyketide synthase [Serratia plymuthica]
MPKIADNQWDTETDVLLQSHHPHAINAWLAQLLYIQLDRLGVFSASAHHDDFTEHADRWGLDPQFQPWWRESIRLLLAAELIAWQDGILVCRGPSSEQAEAVWRAWDDFRDGHRHDPARMTQMNLVDACLRNLPQILTGGLPATEVLFPNASMEKVEGIYKDNPVSDLFNRVLTKTVSDYVSGVLRLDREAQLNLVEIGAGTGGTTAMVLPALMAYQRNIQQYLYTDLSQAFLMHARRCYGPTCPFLDYALWDIEQSLATQPIPPASFDVAIATNVLHATKDIRSTLRHCKAALRNGGMVIINELSDKSVFTHLTFGLLKGWWLHQDTELRIEGSPAIAPDTWREILEEEGFHSVEFPAQKAHALGQTIIVALSNGVIRQQAPLSKKKNQPAIQQATPSPAAPASAPEADLTEERMAAHISEAIVSALAQVVNLSPEQIDAETAFSEYGIDSILTVNFTNKINELIGVRLNPAALYDYRSVASLSGHIHRSASEAVRASLAASSAHEGGEAVPAHADKKGPAAARGAHDANRLKYITDSVIDGLAKTVNLQPERIDEQTALSDFGIDSILSVNFINQINKSLGIALNPAVLYDYATIEALSTHICRAYPELRVIAEPLAAPQPQPPSDRRREPAPQIAAPGAKASEQRHVESDAIAVIGMAGQFPGAEDIQRFWDNLAADNTGIEALPPHYLDPARYSADTDKEAAVRDGKTYCKWGGIVKDRDCFDAKFFRISEQDALSMSPHQRLVLQESWKALEDAGYNPKALSGANAGVFIGAEPANYHHGSFVGSSEAIIASRVSYFLNMKGPAMVVNTGCSSSAVAIHLACESLRRRETELALAGGVFTALDADALASLSGIGLLSRKPACPIFDQEADGMLLSEGIGLVVLKRLDQAIADGDPIHAVIRASGINQDGASNGITAPSGTAQQQLLEQVYHKYRIAPEELSYLEAHATGGKLGDTIEVNALVRAFKSLTAKQHFCALGSVKSHIGHTSAASGVIGLIKIVLSMRHRQLPGLKDYRQINPLFELQDSAFYLQSSASAWHGHGDKPRLAALNSFGHSGTNAHLVIEEYVATQAAVEPANAGWIIPLAAKTPDSLYAQAEALSARLETMGRQGRESEEDTRAFMQSMAYTLQIGREAMPERFLMIVRDHRDCLQQLQAFCRRQTAISHAANAARKQPPLSAEAYQDRGLHRLSHAELETIGRAWLQGRPVNWQSFYSSAPKRIHLPGYSFAKEVFRASGAGFTEKNRQAGSAIADGHYPIGQVGLFRAGHPWSQPFNRHHPVLRHHKAFGQSLMPGLAYIDLLFQFFHRQGMDYRRLEMRNLVIHHPLTIADDYAVEAHISCQKHEQGYWQLRVEGSEVFDDHRQSELKTYMSAEMHSVQAAPFDETLDLTPLKQGATGRLGLREAYETFGGTDIRHSGPMVGDGVIYHLPMANLIDISVPEEPLPGAEDYLFHPVLIDGSAIGSGSLFLEQNAQQDIFLPLYYESFRATAPLSAHCITRISRDSLKQTPQLSYLTMEFFTPHGEKIGELKNFTCKRVRDAAAINASQPHTAVTTQAAAAVMSADPIEPMKNETLSVTAPIVADKHESALECAEQRVKKILADTLTKSPEEIDTDIGYYELGLDSAGLLHMVKLLEQSLKVKLNPTVLFEYANVGELAAYLLEQYPMSFLAADKASAAQGDVSPQTQNAGISTSESQTDAAANNAQQKAPRSSADIRQPAASGDEDIAVIGIAGRYPGAQDMAEFWANLNAGKDSVTEIPAERWRKEILDGVASPSGRPISRWGGFIDDVDCFDSQFFRVSPREAQWLNPQERLFLETCWTAIEDAGYTPETLVAEEGPNKRRDVGVFVGVMHNDYALIAAEIVNRGQVMPLSMNHAPIANRVSYFCGFHGPSLAIDTVCSSSLTALHLALESLHRGESKVAIAGGVNLSLHPYKYMTYGLADMYSTDGRCRTFGDGGNGFVSGEGVGAVLLKPLSQALKDRDNIYALIKGSAINHVGQVSGITVPSPVAQADLMLRCYEKTGIDPRTISYIEAHGTGTALGDPIEIQGLVKAFRQHTPDKQFCAIGSVKSNIGHAESAAGISGLSKVILQLHHKTLVPSLLHAEQVNPYLELEHSPFYIQREAKAWEQPRVERNGEAIAVPRRAGISSFGATGSNAHLIVEEFLPTVSHRTASAQPLIVPLSAKNEDRLRVMAGNLAQFLASHPNLDGLPPEDLAFTLQVGRRSLEERVVFVVQDLRELEQKLAAFATEAVLPEQSWRGSAGSNGKDSARSGGFLTADDSAALLQRWIAQNAVHKIARFWVEGFRVNWPQLYPLATPCRISLPGYPFAREKHWLPAPDDLGRIAHAASAASSDETAAPSSAPVSPEEPERLMLFTESWHKMSAPAAPRQPRDFNTLICFLSQPESQRLLRLHMKTLAPQTEVVFVSREPERRAERVFSLPHAGTEQEQTEHYHHCFTQLKSAQILPQHSAILYLWPLEERGHLPDYAALHHLLSSMVKTGMAPQRLLLAGASHHSLGRAYLESWIGIERSLTAALPSTQCAIAASVVSGANAADERAVLAAHAVTEPYLSRLYQQITAQDFESVCYENEERHVLQVQPSPVSLTGPEETGMKHGGTYLITGGFGGLGLIFARYLAQRYSARLILTGRTAMNAERAAVVDELVRLGGQVHYIQADVCDASAMRFNLAQARQAMGAILGVIHAAGIEAGEPVFAKSRQAFEAVLQPKVDGPQIVDELLTQDPLDFVCYFSSSAAFLGDFGSCDYAMGNRFLMSYGKHRMEQVKQGHLRGRTLIINWPFWAEGKMGAHDKESAGFYLSATGQRALNSAEGLQVFEQLLQQGEGQYLVIAGKPARAAKLLGLDKHTVAGPAPHPYSARPSRDGAATDVTARDLQQPALPAGKMADIRAEVSHILKTLINRLLGTPLDRIGLDSGFADFGFDSITLASFSRELSQRFNLDITPTVLFGHSSVKRLTEYFCREHAPALHAMLSPHMAADTGAAAIPWVQATPAQAPAPETAGERQPASAAAPHAEIGATEEPIAIIGMSGRFPQADSIDEFWDVLIQGKSCIGEMSEPRWDRGSVTDNGAVVPQWGAFMTDIMRFDAAFFDITPKEAMDMDPRQRIFLQEAWRTFEDAGYMGQRIRGMSCGVYVGAEESDYGMLVGEQGSINGNQNATLAARISYALDLKGPNLALTAACASGLVAVHQACLALRQGDCEMALAGGINLLMTPWVYQSMNRSGMLSPDGNASVFDQRANGLVPGEAVAAVLLKPLSKAKADGDRIYGCIKASGVNYDGKTNGITAPNPLRQAELLKNIYDRYQIDPSAIQYVISHSTGSQLGDPIEVQALADAFAGGGGDPHRCVLGSIKPLIGHTFAASGIVSLIAMLKAITHQTMPATHRFETCNRYINLERTPFTIERQNQPWLRRGTQPRLGAISATGISGTNAHAVIEEYIADDPESGQASKTPLSAGAAEHSTIVPISAKTAEALQAYVQACAQFLQGQPATRLEQLAYSLQTGRDAMAQRVAFVAADSAELREQLARFIAGQTAPGVYHISAQSGDNVTNTPAWGDENAAPPPEQIQAWIAARQWQALADAWSRGAEIDWFELYRETRPPQRSAGPVYPFRGKRYWATLSPTTPCGPAVLNAQTAEAASDATMSESKTLSLEAIVRQVRSLLIQTLYFEEDEVANHQPFTELGLNSINAVAFIEAINRSLAAGVTINAIFEHPSIDALSAYLHAVPRGCLAESTEAAPTLSAEQGATAHGRQMGKAWLKQYPECIPLSRQLRAGDEREHDRSRFWIHPLTGSTGLYLKVAENLGDDYAIWGIHSRGFLTRHPPLKSIESMANYYIEILQAGNATGPYELAGYSMGGIIAYEMARQLQLAGYRVSSLILLEPPFPHPEHLHQSSPFYYHDALLMSANFFLHYSLKDIVASGQVAFETLAYREQELMGIDADKQVTWLAEGCLRKGVEQPLSVVKEKIENMAQILKHNREAMAAYVVKALPNAHDIDLHYMTVSQSSNGARSDKGNTSSALAENNRHVLGEALTHDESHCQRWLDYLPGAQVFRTRAKDHFHLLSERESVAMISDRCRTIYQNASARKTTTADAEEPVAKPRQPGRERIAIIGMSGQFPGARNADELWRLLEQGQSTFTPPPDDRGWSAGQYEGYGAFLAEIKSFDPLFFNMSPQEASMLDPCERLFLQESWKAIEDAGMRPDALSGRRWGVFCGSGGDYTLRFAAGEHFAPNITLSQIPGRVSYSLDLKGPCLSVEAGCASSLLAIAQACDHLAQGQCEVAIAGGAQIYSTPNMLISASRFGLLSQADRGGAFSTRASGMMPGESVGVIILKPLSLALAEGDRIHGVIEGWGSNHNGRTHGIMAPSAKAQEALLSDTYQRFDIRTESITLVEAHAAGMPAADAAEIASLNQVFRSQERARQSCALGSVENNIGHAFHSSGMNHLFKVLLALKHRAIPGTPNTEDREALPALEDGPFYINSTTVPWQPEAGQARRAAISSFGATGINVHLVVAEPDSNGEAREEGADGRLSLAASRLESARPVYIALSGKNERALQQRCRELQKFVQARPELDLQQLAANLLLRRTHFAYRCACAVSGVEELRHFLAQVIAGAVLTPADPGYRGKAAPGGQRLAEHAASSAVACVRQAIQDPSDNGNWLRLARLYVDGVDFMTQDFHAGADIAQAFSSAEKFPLSLPTYPFDARLCWAGNAEPAPVGKSSADLALEQTPAPAAAPQPIVQKLLGILAELAGLARTEIDPDEPITHYGIDSLLGLRLLNRINSAFVTAFDAELLTRGTLRAIAGEIAAHPLSAPVAAPQDAGSASHPAYIQSTSLAIRRASALTADELTLARAELGRLLQQGVGVWKDSANLHVEFNRNAPCARQALEHANQTDILGMYLEEGVRYYPTSHIQAFVLHETEVKKRATFNIGQGFWLDMPIDLALLNQALNDMARRHAILRTGAELVGQQWAQVVHEALTLECREICWPHINDRATFEQIFARFQQSVNIALFHADRMPMFDVYLVHNGADLGAIYLATHHFHADGFTLFMLLQELYLRYTALLGNTEFVCDKSTAEYAHFALSQFGEHRDSATAYWLSQLRDKRASFALRDKYIARQDQPNKAGNVEKAGVYHLPVSDEMLGRLQASNRRHKTTLTQLATCALAVLAYRITGVNIPIQMAYNLRDRYEFEPVYGDFSSSVPLVLTLQPHFNLQQVWHIYEDAILQVQKYKHFDFVALHQQLAPSESAAHEHTLLGSLAVDSNDRDSFVEVTAFARKLLPMSLEEREPAAPLLMGLLKTNGVLSLPFVYDRRYFSPDLIRVLAEHVGFLLTLMVEQPELKVEDIPVPEMLIDRLSPEEVAALDV